MIDTISGDKIVPLSYTPTNSIPNSKGVTFNFFNRAEAELLTISPFLSTNTSLTISI